VGHASLYYSATLLDHTAVPVKQEAQDFAFEWQNCKFGLADLMMMMMTMILTPVQAARPMGI
jgi:hypothetical protein